MRILDVWSAQMGKMGERAKVPNRDLFLSFRGVWLRLVAHTPVSKICSAVTDTILRNCQYNGTL